MKVKIFKDYYMFRPLQTIVVDRPFELDGDEMHVLALTYEESSYSLWVMDCLSNEADESGVVIDSLDKTNRYFFEKREVSEIRSIETLEIGEKIFNFNGTSTEYFNFDRSQAFHKLQYFIDHGVELHQWDDVELTKTRLIRHKYSGSNQMVNINLQDEEITLNFRPYQKVSEVFYKYSVDFNLDKPLELKYYNPFEEKEEYFYVQGFEKYDLENYINSIEANEKYKDVPKEHLDNMRDTMVNYFEDLKSKNSSLILMTYEAERGLSFQSTELLDRKIEVNSSGSSIGLIFGADKGIGEHGKRLFIASFQDVPNSQLDTIEFELHSVSKNYKGVSVII